MAESFVAWVDYSLEERDRMRRAIALFKETDTVDELGLGRIRDALADQLFPGTSTIQTRLRYFLIVPWVYAALEKRGRINGQNVARRARTQELDLIEPLTRNGDEGVFGSVSGRTVKRLPSSVYWNGLRRWKILCHDISQDELHRRWDHVRAHNQTALVPDDPGIPADRVRMWEGIPNVPDGWPNVVSLDVTHAEAVFLRSRMESCENSLLAHLASVAPEKKADVDTARPWDAIDGLPAQLHSLLDQAKAFAMIMWGTGLLYSLDLCEHSQHESHKVLVEGHRHRLDEWATEAKEVPRLWDPNDLWTLLEARGAGIARGRPDRTFVEHWWGLAREVGTTEMADDRRARELVRERERAIKRQRSRYDDPRALDRWGGDSGTRLIDYRWRTVRRLLQDLYEGLERVG